MERKRNILRYIVMALVISWLIALYIALVQPFEVCYCMDGVQENIIMLKQEIAKVQNELKLCNHDLKSGVLSAEEFKEISDYKADLTKTRQNYMEYLGKFRELETRYLNAEIVVSNKDN